jgi:hypothetical protein
MATNSPVQVGQLWTSVQAGEFGGSIQNLGNFPLVGFVADGDEKPPPEGAGGFAIYSQPTAIQIGQKQALWVRAVCGENQAGVVILA